MSTYKDIGVFVDEVDGQEPLIEFAAELATRFQAKLTGVCAIPQAPNITAFQDKETPGSFVRDFNQAVRDHANIVHAMFLAATEARDVDSRWIERSGTAGNVIPREFRLCDLGVIGQPSDVDMNSRRESINAIVLNSARPVLCVPYQGVDPEFGSRVLVGYDGGIHATRAIHDALPFLKLAEHVELFSVRLTPTTGKTFHVDVMAEHLRHHGVNASAEIQECSDDRVAEKLLERAECSHANLIVVGAWGHPSAREHLLGGTTEKLIRDTPYPVIFSH